MHPLQRSRKEGLTQITHGCRQSGCDGWADDGHCQRWSCIVQNKSLMMFISHFQKIWENTSLSLVHQMIRSVNGVLFQNKYQDKYLLHYYFRSSFSAITLVWLVGILIMTLWSPADTNNMIKGTTLAFCPRQLLCHSSIQCIFDCLLHVTH